MRSAICHSPIQVKLLRFLQEQTFMRVGGRHEIQCDVRIIAATHADLKTAIAGAKFREDLYFRLAVVVIVLPPLRERGDDIVVVATEFLQRFAAQSGKTGLTFAPETLRAASRYSWPGNVREVQNRVHRAVIMADGKRITPADMELTHVTTRPPGGHPQGSAGKYRAGDGYASSEKKSAARSARPQANWESAVLLSMS